ncbi:IQ calmodulinbinding motif domain containing protein [Acanthamoeba castellanii str. Neff]|uniref:IQ calmodulinbinding motif domain containing protein n=1 Tax=Acanthamoeba castellanii (strain ATCC 30010 / Neff) TaxID=1257118 RepID=L8HE89_ACACF|nr:IQ calmodulinbinding motif domain containing protein [Acanthamoeba castellanii str. Neff]ELR23068.1 IQ calmodulinbinding motif domain containing protein [Acanthamoeba castellanii str. Neff]
MRRLRGIAASARVHHSRSTSLQDLPAVAALGGEDPAASGEAGLAGNGLISSSESTSSPLKGGENGTSSSFPGLDESNIFEDDEEEQHARDLIRRWKETRSHLKIEKSELIRSVLLLLNVLAQIILTVVALEYEWDGVRTLRDSRVALGIRVAISVLTGLLVIQMVEDDAWKIWKDAKDTRKRAKHAKQERRKGRFEVAVGEVRRQFTHRRFYMPIGDEGVDYSFHTPTWMILMEYLPFPPGLDDDLTKLAAMLTFLKLFVTMSVLRHFNPIYRNRHLIIRIPGSSLIEMPRFTTWFSTRTFYHQYPLTFSLSNIIAVVAITAYGMYIYEREVQPHVFDFKLCFVIATENLITGWPGDVFSQYTLESDGGKSFSVFASLGGLFFFALLINFLYIKLSPSSNDSHVVDWIARIKLEDKERHEAAKLIQLVWRRRLERKKKEEERLINGDHGRHYHFITVPSEKAYQVRFRRQCREMRHVRREKQKKHKKSKKEKEKVSKGQKKKKKQSDDTRRALRHRRDSYIAAVAGQAEQEQRRGDEEAFALLEQQHHQQQLEWEAQRARLRKYYAKAAKNLNKLMAELGR